MAIQNTTNLSDSIRTLYIAKYMEAAQLVRLYDQLSHPVSQDGVENAARMGATITVPFLSDMVPGTTALSQAADITPQILVDTTGSITATSRGEALQWAEALDVQAYTDYGAKRYAAVGKNMMETVDMLARDAANQGSLVLRGAARASLDAGTSGHRLSDAIMSEVETTLQTLKCPPYLGNGRNQWLAIMHPEVFYDLRTGGNVANVAIYQDKEIVLNWELGQLGPFKLIVSPWAKVFIGQGLANGTEYSSGTATLSTAAAALDKTIEVSASLSAVAGDWVNIIDTAETGATHVGTNERVKYVSGTTTATIIGEGANGGLRFPHAAGASVTNADSVFPVAYGGPFSMAKIFDSGTGEFGMTVGPKKNGLLDQFASLGWKFYGGYGRWVESWLVRGEYSSSLEA